MTLKCGHPDNYYYFHPSLIGGARHRCSACDDPDCNSRFMQENPLSKKTMTFDKIIKHWNDGMLSLGEYRLAFVLNTNADNVSELFSKAPPDVLKEIITSAYSSKEFKIFQSNSTQKQLDEIAKEYREKLNIIREYLDQNSTNGDIE